MIHFIIMFSISFSHIPSSTFSSWSQFLQACWVWSCRTETLTAEGAPALHKEWSRKFWSRTNTSWEEPEADDFTHSTASDVLTPTLLFALAGFTCLCITFHTKYLMLAVIWWWYSHRAVCAHMHCNLWVIDFHCSAPGCSTTDESPTSVYRFQER